MSSNYERAAAALERLQQDQIRAETRLEEGLKELKREFGVSSLKEAKKLLAKLEAEELEAENEFNTKYEAFVRDYSEYLEAED